jgi:uncharacterized membrane protein YhhN
LSERASRRLAWLAIAAAAVGVFSTWTSAGAVDLDGVQGPNNGWLVLIVAAFALAWTRSMARGSRIGVAGVLGAAVVMGWTAVENWLDSRDVFGAGARFGLLLVVAASIVLAGTAVARAVAVKGTASAGTSRSP